MRFGVLALAGILMLVAGCDSLVYVHTMDIGVDLAAAPTQGNVKLVVGYDRFTLAMVPKKTTDHEAQAITSASYVHINGLTELQISHAVATGKPAVYIAHSPADLQAVVDQIFGITSSSPPAQTQPSDQTPTAGPSTKPTTRNGGGN